MIVGVGRLMGGSETSVIPPPAPPMTNLQMWLAADQQVYQDSAFTTPATANGQSVRGWKDLTANGNNITLTSGTAPVLKTNALNSLPSVNVTAGNTLFGLSTSALDLGVSCHVYIVFKRGSAIAFAVILANSPAAQGFFSTGPSECDFSLTNGNQSNIPLAANLGFNLLEGSQSGTTVTAWCNGVGSNGTSSGTGTFRFTQMSGYPGGTLPMIGEITELLAYNITQSGADQLATRAYLNSRYAIF